MRRQQRALRAHRSNLESSQEKKARKIRASLFGGGGGNRTRVRKPSALGSTCLALFILFNLPSPNRQGDQSAIPLGFSGSGPDFRHRDPV
jgi:hypothetical protein